MTERRGHQADTLDVRGVVTWTALGATALVLVLAVLYVALGRPPPQHAGPPERLWADRPPAPPPRLAVEPQRQLAAVRAREEAWFRSVDIHAAMAQTRQHGWREGDRYPVPGRPQPPEEER